ncbi:MAG: radical SAM protein [archaeon]
MKILLIEPNVQTSNYVSQRDYRDNGELESPWAGYLAAVIGRRHDIKFINCSFPPTDSSGYFSIKRKKSITDIEILNNFRKFSPSVVAFTSYEKSFERVVKLAKKFKRTNPACKIVLGGHYPTFTYTQLLDGTWCDIVVVGEGFITIKELVSCINAGKSFDEVKGIAYLENNRIVYTGRREPLKDLDVLPFPDRQIYPKCKELTDSSILIISSMGCPWGKCTFCSIGAFYNGRHYATRSAKNILDEIESVARVREVKSVHFVTEGALYQLKSIINEKVKRGLNFKFTLEARIDEILRFKDSISYAKKNGLDGFLIGIEVFSDRILKIFNKGLTCDKIISALDYLDDLRIPKLLAFIPFSPWITREEFLYNLRMMLNCAVWKDPRLYYIPLNEIFQEVEFYAGTELRKQYGRSLDYENADLKKALDRMTHIRSINKRVGDADTGSVRLKWISLARYVAGSIRAKSKYHGKGIPGIGLNAQYITINKEDTPCLINKDRTIYRLNGKELRAMRELKQKSPNLYEEIGMVILPSKSYLVDVMRKRAAPITKEQLVFAQYSLMGLTEGEIRKQFEYEKLRYAPGNIKRYLNIKRDSLYRREV